MSNLQMLREKAGFLSPEALAYRAGVSGSTVRRAEKGVSIRRKQAILIALAVGKTIEQMDEIEGLNYVGKVGHDEERTEALG